MTARKEEALTVVATNQLKPLTSTAHLSTLIFLFISLLSADITSLFSIRICLDMQA